MITIKFEYEYEGMCRRTELENTEDPFEDVSILAGESFEVLITEFQNEEDDKEEVISFRVLNDGKYIKTNDILFNVPVEILY